MNNCQELHFLPVGKSKNTFQARFFWEFMFVGILIAVLGAHAFAQAAPPSPIPSAAALDLASVANLYQTGLVRIQADRDGKLAKLAAAYRISLDKLLQELASNAQLEAALATKAERDGFIEGKELDPKQKKAMPAKLLSLRSEYEKSRKTIFDDAQRRIEVLRKQYIVSLEQLQRQLTMSSQFEKASAVKVERERVGGFDGVGTSITGPLPPEAARRLFQLPEKDWLISGDTLFGHFEDSNNKSKPMGPSTELRFSFRMKARWYHGINVWVDDERFCYCRGRANGAAVLLADGKETRLSGVVTDPDKWAILAAVVKDGKIRFYYNGKLEGEKPVKAPKQAAYMFNVGFQSYKADVQIKDCSVELFPARK